MRIVGGAFRGRSLVSVGKGDEKNHLRPTTDRIRESLFNMLAHGPYPELEGARVLDLFAGTGALGLEALSRGAAHVTFVENGRAAQRLIRANIDQFGCREATTLLPLDAAKLRENNSLPFDLCFADPPYNKGLGLKSIQALAEGNWLTQDAIIVLEEGEAVVPPAPFRCEDTRQFGDTHMHFIAFQR